MTKVELKRILAVEGIRDDSFCLGGGHPNEAYTLEESGGRWFVYYSERGLERGKNEFSNESDACLELLARLRKDPTTRNRG